MKLKSCVPADCLLVTTVCDLPLNADWMLSGAQPCLHHSLYLHMQGVQPLQGATDGF